MHIYDVFARVGKLAPRCVIAKINIITADSRVAPHLHRAAQHRSGQKSRCSFSHRTSRTV